MAISPIDEVVETVTKLQHLLGDANDRSIAIGVVNQTDYTLSLTQSDGQSNFAHGGYQSGNIPSDSIGPHEADVFGTTNTGVATGVEGVVHYTATDSDGNDAGVIINLNFDNPAVGSNTFTANAEDLDTLEDSTNVFVHAVGSRGNSAQVRYTITARQA